MGHMTESSLCPFSKPIIGQWCRCQNAILAERCSGKMICSKAEDYRPSCVELVDLFKRHSRFVLGLADDTVPLTHSQSMKVRCGGLLGMQRLLQSKRDVPSVAGLISAAEKKYGKLAAFPFSDIVRDINSFSHRKKFKKP